MSQLPPGGMSPLQEPVDGGPDAVLVVGCAGRQLILMLLVLGCAGCGGGVDAGDDAGRRGRSRLAGGRVSVVRVGPSWPRKVLVLFGVLGPDGPVAGVVGGLRAAGGVTHPGQRLGRRPGCRRA